MGKVIGVDRKKYYIHVEGITREKAGAKEAGKTSTTIPIPIRASRYVNHPPTHPPTHQVQ